MCLKGTRYSHETHIMILVYTRRHAQTTSYTANNIGSNNNYLLFGKKFGSCCSTFSHILAIITVRSKRIGNYYESCVVISNSTDLAKRHIIYYRGVEKKKIEKNRAFFHLD